MRNSTCMDSSPTINLLTALGKQLTSPMIVKDWKCAVSTVLQRSCCATLSPSSLHRSGVDAGSRFKGYSNCSGKTVAIASKDEQADIMPCIWWNYRCLSLATSGISSYCIANSGVLWASDFLLALTVDSLAMFFRFLSSSRDDFAFFFFFFLSLILFSWWSLPVSLFSTFPVPLHGRRFLC